VLVERGRHQEAEAAYRKALEVIRPLAERRPAVPEHQHRLAAILYNLADVLSNTKKTTEAKATYESVLAIYTQLIEQNPSNVEYAVSLGGCHVNYGILLEEDGATKALEHYSTAIQMLQPLLTNGNQLSKLSRNLRNAYWNRADLLARLDRHAEAIKDLDQALKLADDKSEPKLRLLRAESLIGIGQHQKAIEEVSAVASRNNVSAETYFDAACVLALASAAVKDDPKLQDQYAARAVELLRQAVAKGYKDIDRLKKDDDLKALRDREDFKKLLADLEKQE